MARNSTVRSRLVLAGVFLRCTHGIAQVGYADTGDDGRVAQDGGRDGKALKETDAGTRQYRHEIDADFVEASGIRQLLDGVGPVNADGFTGSRGPGLIHGALDAVGHEVDCRTGAWPAGGNPVDTHECRPRVRM